MMSINGYGSYLVRDSQTTPGDYTLSVRDRVRIWSYRIKRSNGTFSITKCVTFETIQGLVAYYQRQRDGLHVDLIRPCVKESSQTIGHSEHANKAWEIDRSEIKIIKKLMDGEFSEVWEGLWNKTTLVAVKIFKPQNLIMTAYDFVQTANLMKRLYHQNVIQICAVCTKEEPMYIITELMKHNSLLEYLRGEGRSIKHPLLIGMASQVIDGMAYLEEQKCVHRDLAAKNIRVGESLICKLANFEMARMIDEAQHQIAEIDPKWAAPEALLYNKFTIKSDVWSFGIVLHEIITYGDSPYPTMTTTEVFEQLQQGYRMPQSMGCPDKLYDIMLYCWQEEPANRPTFKALQCMASAMEFFC